jgi:hypothetical protein
MRLTVVPDAKSLALYSVGTLAETQRIDAFTVITIDLECNGCGQTTPAWARYETTGFALTNPYLPLSLELTILWDGVRIGRVAVKKRRREAPTLLGDFIPEPGLVELPAPIAEAHRAITVLTATAESDEEMDAAHERYTDLGEDNARRIRLPELPAAELEWFAFTDAAWSITMTARNRHVGEYATRHPPRCLRGLSTVPQVDPVPGLDRQADEASFRVACPCGERACYVLGYFWEGEGPTPRNIFVGPLALECPQCGRVSEFIDTRQHGYNGEQGCDGNMTGEGPRVRFPCPQCGEVPLAVTAVFSYDGHEYDPLDPKARPQDYFGSVGVCGECSRCGKRILNIGFETA